MDYTTSDGTARAGEDYQAVSGTLEFQQNETVKTFAIPVLADGVAENTETFRVILSNTTGEVVLELRPPPSPFPSVTAAWSAPEG